MDTSLNHAVCSADADLIKRQEPPSVMNSEVTAVCYKHV